MMDCEFSESQNACFIVQDSQEESEYSQMNASKMLMTLSALKGANMKVADQDDQHLYSPRKSDMPQSQGNTRVKGAASGSQSGHDDNPQQQGREDEAGDGNGGAGGYGDGGGGGAGYGGGGEDQGAGGGGEDEEEASNQGGDGEAEDEEHAEEGTPSTSGGSSGSVPPLVEVEVGQQNVPLGVQGHVAEQPQQENLDHNGADQHQNIPELEVQPPSSPGSGTGGGLSDATTAVVSSSGGGISDATTAVIGSDTDVQGCHTSPARLSLSSPRRPGHDISSTHSTLSSFTSSSSDAQTSQQQLTRKRLLPRKLHQPSKKQKRQLDVSTTDTSGRDTTSSSSRKDTTTSDTSHDTSKDRSPDMSGDQPHEQDQEDDNCPGSQEDLFDDDDGNQPGPSTRGGNRSGAGNVMNKSDFLFATPAEKLGSLQFSGEPKILAAESIPDEESPDEIPPSQDVFECSVPRIIPSTPTPPEDNPDQLENVEAFLEVKKPISKSESTSSSANGTITRTKSFQEWQPSYQSCESSSRSRPASSTAPGPSLERKNGGSSDASLPRSSGGQNQSGKSSRRKNMTEPVESQLDIEITSVAPGSSKNRKADNVTEDFSVALNLQLGMTEQNTCDSNTARHDDQTKDIIDVSGEDSSADIILVEPEKQIIKIDSNSSKSEEHQQSPDEDITVVENPREAEECSQGLALHLSQSQNTGYSTIVTKQQETAEAASLVIQTERTSPLQLDKSVNVGSQASTQAEESFHLNIPREGSLLHPSVILSPPKLKDNLDQSAVEPSPALPSLTLDMIDTVPEENSMNSAATGAFTLYRPSLLETGDAPESENVSVFTKAKDVPDLRRCSSSKSSKSNSNEDPYEYSEAKELQEQVKFVVKQAQKEKLRQMLREQQTQETSGMVVRKICGADEGQQSSEEVYDQNTEKMDVSLPSDNTVIDKDKLKQMLGQATMEYEDEGSNSPETQKYDYTVVKDKQKVDINDKQKGISSKKDGKLVEQKGSLSKEIPVRQIGTGQSTKQEDGVNGKNDKSKSGKSSKSDRQNPSQKKIELSKSSQDQQKTLLSKEIMSSGKKSKGNQEVDSVGYKILHRLGETPRSHHKRKVHRTKGSQPVMSRVQTEDDRLCVSDPYEYRLSQSQRDRDGKNAAIQLQERARMKADFQMLPEAITTAQTVPVEPVQKPDCISAEKPTTSKSTNDSAGGTGKQSGKATSSSGSVDDSVKGDNQRPKPVQKTSSCSNCGQRTFHTLKIHTITEILEERIGNKVVNRRVISTKTETFSQDDESWSSPSPSRTIQSLTSGDLGDISSFSGSGPPVKHHCTLESSRSSLPSSVSFGSMGKPPSYKRTSVSQKPSSLLSKSSSSKEAEAVVTPELVATRTQKNPSRQTSTESDTVPIADANMSQSLQPAQVHKSPKSTESSDTKRTSDTGLGSEFSCAELKSIKKTLSSAKAENNQNVFHQTSTNNSAQTAGQSESLFSTVDESEPQSVALKKKGSLTKKRSRSSSSSTKYSESLFSTVSSETEPQGELKQAETMFVKPTDVQPESAKRHSSDTGKKSIEKYNSSESEAFPPTDTEMAYPYKDHSVSYINREDSHNATSKLHDVTSKHDGRTNQTPPNKECKESRDEEDISPEIPVVAEPNTSVCHPSPPLAASSTSSSSISQRDILCVPPYWPTSLVDPGTAVLAMWKDKHYYPGLVVAVEKIRNKDIYQVLFEDDTQRNVKPAEVIVCDLLAVGQKCLAETEDGWSVPCTVLGHHVKKDVKSCIVKFEDGKTEKISRKYLSLNKDQVQELVTATVASVIRETDQVPDIEETEVKIDPSMDNNIAQEVSSCVDSEHKTRCVSSGQTSVKKNTKGGKSKKTVVKDEIIEPKKKASEEEYEVLNPISAYLPPVATALNSGVPVYAKWKDKHYYPGYIRSQKDAGSCREYVIEFEDGDVRNVKTDNIIVCDLLRLGQSVLAAKEKDLYESAIVLGHWKKGQEIGYDVEFEDQVNCKLTRATVILTEDQACTLIEEDIKPFTTPKPSAADVTLENLVEGKRVRALKSAAKESSQGKSKSSQSSSKSQSKDSENNPVPSSSGVQSTGGKKRKLMGTIEPKYHSTPTPNKRRVVVVSEEELDLGAPSPVGELLESPIMKGKRRRARHELFSAVKGPIPPAGSTIFKGMIFLLSHVDKSEEEQKKEKEALKLYESVSTTDDSAAEEEPAIPFDKEHLIQQLECGGGEVIQNLDYTALHESDQCFLVSDTHQRTLKYLSCLALAKPCVSHVWIKDSCVTGCLQDHKSYLLPAGLCIETNRLVELPRHPRPLTDVSLMISSQNPRFPITWRSILEAAGAKLLDKLPERQSQRDRITAVIADSYVSASVVSKAADLQVPVLSSEWVIQSLISGKTMSYHGHARYKYDYFAK